MDKVKIRELLQKTNKLTSQASIKRFKIINDLGHANSVALEQHKQKLEKRTLKNYEAVLEDLRGELSNALSGKTLEKQASASHRSKLMLESTVMLKKLSVMKAPKERSSACKRED